MVGVHADTFVTTNGFLSETLEILTGQNFEGWSKFRIDRQAVKISILRFRNPFFFRESTKKFYVSKDEMHGMKTRDTRSSGATIAESPPPAAPGLQDPLERLLSSIFTTALHGNLRDTFKST